MQFPLGAVNLRSGWCGNAACTPLRRGLITPEDLRDAINSGGALPYTLQFGMPQIGNGAPRYPATHNAPTCNSSCANHIVEGTWVRLNPSYDVEGSGLPAWQKVIARTLQTKGAILRDNGGTLVIYAENPINRGVSWGVAGLSGTSAGFSGSFPWAQLQILSPPLP
jgi:hypothetical protein